MAFASLSAGGRQLRIEYEWAGTAPQAAPLLVFLHEGLGSVAMWRDFPQRLCDAVGARGLVYSRAGYGRSTPKPPDERWKPDFMHVEAREVLPALLRTLDVRERPWLFGHSDGGSIALLHAAAFPDAVQGLVVLAPHIFVEEVSVASIREAREAWRTTDLRQRLARYHDDPDSAFHGWNDAWLDPAFRDWNIEGALGTIRCPLLAIQGLDDEYGTMEQIRGIARRVPQAQLLELRACGHSPHRDQPDAVIRAVSRCMQAGTPAR
ncbi:MAG: alpha/beta hydrolase fold protein [Ramlibacter sp.]|jgi:pimeloyl-ACP methyl ester carboxylesterase|nr:alpha/beta hydrolase fold protein [Ramlibacter sp.]